MRLTAGSGKFKLISETLKEGAPERRTVPKFQSFRYAYGFIFIRANLLILIVLKEQTLSELHHIRHSRYCSRALRGLLLSCIIILCRSASLAAVACNKAVSCAKVQYSSAAVIGAVRTCNSALYLIFKVSYGIKAYKGAANPICITIGLYLMSAGKGCTKCSHLARKRCQYNLVTQVLLKRP